MLHESSVVIYEVLPGISRKCTDTAVDILNNEWFDNCKCLMPPRFSHSMKRRLSLVSNMVALRAAYANFEKQL